MTEIAHRIELNLRDKLNDRSYRRKFFLAEASSLIATQIITLRKRRVMNQRQLAELAGTQQPAISRVEKADYQNWSFNTLRSIADALDARIRVYIEPYEDVLTEYEQPQTAETLDDEDDGATAQKAFFERNLDSPQKPREDSPRKRREDDASASKRFDRQTYPPLPSLPR